MEPLDENELSRLLRRWEAPAAPPTLGARVLPARASWRNWLLRGAIRVPVPVALAAALSAALWLYHSWPVSPPRAAQPSVSLADFQPVRQLEPILVRGGRK
jgi:hypothetical protein